MKFWLVAEPVCFGCADVVWKIYSEDAILAEYWEYWSTKMIAKNFPEMTYKRCIEDWVTVNWAIPATEAQLLNIITVNEKPNDYSNC